MTTFETIFVKVKKEITLGTLLSILVPIGISILLWAISVSGDVALHHEQIIQVNEDATDLKETTNEIRKDLEQDNADIRNEINQTYKALDKKIDKIYDHLINK